MAQQQYVETVHWPEEGYEVLHELRVRDFPAGVLPDTIEELAQRTRTVDPGDQVRAVGAHLEADRALAIVEAALAPGCA